VVGQQGVHEQASADVATTRCAPVAYGSAIQETCGRELCTNLQCDYQQPVQGQPRVPAGSAQRRAVNMMSTAIRLVSSCHSFARWVMITASSDSTALL
jgi:N-acetylmuramic acid 6-phosphate (MurNAc-6-P) etherase